MLFTRLLHVDIDARVDSEDSCKLLILHIASYFDLYFYYYFYFHIYYCFLCSSSCFCFYFYFYFFFFFCFRFLSYFYYPPTFISSFYSTSPAGSTPSANSTSPPTSEYEIDEESESSAGLSDRLAALSQIRLVCTSHACSERRLGNA